MDRITQSSQQSGIRAPNYNEEVETVMKRTNQCLVHTNMSDFFIKKGYDAKVKDKVRRILSVLRTIIPKFNSSYDVPCWKMPLTVYRTSASHTSKKNINISGTIGNFKFSYREDDPWSKHTLDLVEWNSAEFQYLKRSIVCLPKVFLLGYPKCGSTFLYCILRQVISASQSSGCSVCEARKEPRWWISNHARNQLHLTSSEYMVLYLLNFDKGAQFVEDSFPAVTIDASPNHMFQTMKYPESSIENYCLLPSLLPVILPDSKYFVVMRNPITMLYSAFWFSCTMLHKDLEGVKNRGPDIFHELITTKIAKFNKCKDKGTPVDMCVDQAAQISFSPAFPKCGTTRLEIGFYYFHARKWLSVIPRERILFFTMEELVADNPSKTAKVILDHLGLPPANTDLPAEFVCNENIQDLIDYKHDPRLKMREDTRQILEEFFQPYNQMLADLLGDSKFLWNSIM